jgi:hypothetical protein
MDYADLAAQLPKSELAIADGVREGVGIPSSRSRSFVAPSLSVRSGDLDDAHVVVVSAPAAAGKSTLAWELAAETRGVLVDLAHWNVGNNFLSGTFFKMFADKVGLLLTEIAAGRSALIIDAVEEGQLRSGESNFEKFLDDLVDYASTFVGTAPTVVLFARAETTEYLTLYLESRSVKHAVVGIEYFNSTKAKKFIDLQLDTIEGESGAHREQRTTFVQVRDLLWEMVAGTLPVGDLEPDSFLGYPPVLAAMSNYLAVDNFQSLGNALRDIGARSLAGGPWSFISTILDDILTREQRKFAAAVGERLTTGADIRRDLFGPDEQACRLYDLILGRSPDDLLLPKLPEDEQASYLSATEVAISQHAFMGDGRNFTNTVFRDYVEAIQLVSPNSTRRRAAREDILGSGRPPSPLLGRFLLGMTGDRALAGPELGIVYDSLSAQEVVAGNIHIVVNDEGHSQAARAYVRFESTNETLEFMVDTSEGPVSFQRRLRDAVIDSDGHVGLGSPVSDFIMGPGVSVTSSMLSFESSLTRVILGDEPVLIQADLIDLPSGGVQLKVVGDGILKASWPDMTFPWIAYKEDIPTEEDDDAELYDLLRHLSHIFKYFVRHRREPLQAPKLLVDNIAVGRSPDARRVLSYLIEIGVVTVSADGYQTDLDALAARGINYMDLRSRTLTPALRELLRDVGSLGE